MSMDLVRKLVEAKSLLPHGEWGKWLEKSVAYSQRTANDLMRIFNEYGSSQITFLEDNLNSQTYANLSYSNALALLGLPTETREKFVEDNNVEDMSTRELKRAIEELKRADKEKEKALKERDKALEKISALEETNRILEDTFNEGAEERNLLVEKIAELEKELEDVKSRKVESEDIDYIETMKEVQAKIDKILEEKEELERKLKATEGKQNDSSVKFKIYFKEEAELFQKLMEELEYVKKNSEVEHIKLKGALQKFLNSMLERLE